MRPRTLLAAALLVVAGCSGLGPSGTASHQPTATVTPAPVPDAGAQQLAPGLTNDGIVNGTALVRAHRSVLENRSFVHLSRAAIVYDNGTVYDASESRTAVDARNGTSVRVVDGPDVVRPADADRTTVWSNGSSRAVRREYRDGSVEYEFHQERSSFDHRRPLAVYPLVEYDASPTGERTVDGTTEYVLASDAVTDIVPSRDERIRKAGSGRLRAFVTEDGLVRTVTVRAPVEIGDASGRFSSVEEYDLDPGPVGRPEWVTTAAERDADGNDTSTPART